MSGLETLMSAGGGLARVHSVASFFVSTVDTEVDRRLDDLSTVHAEALNGKAAIAQARLAYQMFQTRFTTPRWRSLEEAGARVQQLLWASTSTKNPEYLDTKYVDELIGPETVTNPKKRLL